MRSRRSLLVALAGGLLAAMLGTAVAAAAEPPMVNDGDLGAHLKDVPIWFSVEAVDAQLQVPNHTFELGTPSHGTAIFQGEVTCSYGLPFGICHQGALYTPDSGYTGPDSFTFTATDQNTGLASTATVSVTLIADETPPSGDLAVYSNDLSTRNGYTRTSDLLVRAQASDNFRLAKLRLSNTGTTSNGMLTTFIESNYENQDWPYLVPWQMSNVTGGSSTQGTKTVYAQWSDTAGNWSPVKSATIRYDTVAPSVTAVRVAIAASAYNSGVPFRISFTTSEAGTYEMQRSADGGAWSPVNYDLANRQATLGHSSNHQYRYRVRMFDWAGNASPWKYSVYFTPGYYAQNSSRVTYSGSWTKVYYVDVGWTMMRSRTYGSWAKFTFTGKGVSWQTVKGPTRGKAQIYVDGKLVKTVDLYASKNANVFAYSKQWASSGTHSLRVRVLGTSGRPYVDVDGFGILK